MLTFLRVMHLRQLKSQPLRTVLAVVALSAGVAITVGTGHLVTSLERSLRDVLRSITGAAPVTITGTIYPSGLDTDVLGKVKDVPGVSEAAPTVLRVAVLEKRSGQEFHALALGVDCRIERVVGAFGCDPEALRSAAPNQPVVMSGALKRELGAGAVIRTNIGRFPLGDVIVNDSLDASNQGRILVFDLGTAQRLFGRPDRLDTIYVQPDPGTDLEALRTRLEGVVGGWNAVLLRGELPPYLGFGGPLGPLLAMAGMLALGLAGLLVYNIVALSLAERRRDLAVAGAIGATPRAVTGGVLVEAAILGLAGGVLGAAGGLVLAPVLVDTISSVLLEQAIGMRATTYASASVLLTGVALGVVTSVVASFFPARRTRKLDLAAELHGRASQVEDAPRRLGVRLAVFLVVGGACVFVTDLAQRGGALEQWQASVAPFALIIAAGSLIAAVGSAAPLVLRYVLRPLRATSGSLRLAVSNLVGRARRTTVMATSVGAAVALACVLGALVPAMKASTGSAVDPFGQRVWISTLPMNNAGGSARPSDRTLRAIERLPGVASITPNRCVSIGDGGEGVGVCTMTWKGDRPPFRPVVGDVSLEALERGEAILGTSVARTKNVRPGSMLTLTTPEGFVDVRVAGIWKSSGDNGYRVSLSDDRFVQLYGPDRAENLWVEPEPGVTGAELVERIEEADVDPDLYALTAREASLRLADEVGDQVEPFWMLQRLLLFVALIATLSTLLLVGVQRRREFGVLGAVGFGPRLLARLTITEAVVGGAAGALLGVLASFGMFEALRNLSAVAIGTRPPFSFDASSALASTTLALVIVAIGGAIPAWRASRLQMVEAIRDE